MARFITLGEAVKQVMSAIGLSPPTAVIGGNNATANQLVALANDLGNELLTKHDWQQFIRDMTITTEVGEPNYALPADFCSFYADAQWNFTTRLPALGDLSQAEWNMLKARNLGGTTIASMFNIQDGFVTLFYVPQSAQVLKFPYKSSNWVQKADASYANKAEADDDTILYDPALFKIALRREFFIAKGLDNPRVEVKYQQLLNEAKGKDTPGRTLSLRNRPEYPYIGVLNLPDTGYGS